MPVIPSRTDKLKQSEITPLRDHQLSETILRFSMEARLSPERQIEKAITTTTTGEREGQVIDLLFTNEGIHCLDCIVPSFWNLEIKDVLGKIEKAALSFHHIVL